MASRMSSLVMSLAAAGRKRRQLIVDQAHECYRDLHVVIFGERSGADGVEEVAVDDMSS